MTQVGSGIFHVNAPFQAREGQVFVDLGGEWWGLGEPGAVLEEGRTIIKCRYCEAPAVQLDHLWPYQTEQTACARHKEMAPWRNRGRLRARKEPGRIKEHVALCGVCLYEYTVQGLRNLQEMVSLLRKAHGWHKTRRAGWMCPDCYTKRGKAKGQE